MSATSKILGVVAGLSTVAVIGVAVAQGVPPNPNITNPAIGAGQQSSQHTAMGETGVPAFLGPLVQTAQVQPAPEPVAVAPAAPAEPAPAPVAAAEPAPAAEPAQTTVMGAAPSEPAPVVAQAPRADRN